ncbi:ankyrin repeat-containing domain protein [Aspergillus venezuelensis]
MKTRKILKGQFMRTASYNVINLLLQYSPDLCATDTRFSLLVQIVAANGYGEFMKPLVESEVDVNARGHRYGNALQAAARYGQLQCLKILLDAGAATNVVGGKYGTPLNAAIIGSNDEVFQELIHRGVDLNLVSVVDYSTVTPLQLAVKLGKVHMVRHLMVAGANARSSADLVYTAVEMDHFEMTQMLSGFGATADSQNTKQETAPLVACWRSNERVVELLLNNKADPNAMSPTGPFGLKSGPLHTAAWWGRSEIAQLLLRYGAVVERRNKVGQKPLAVAALRGHLEVMQLLLSAGAKISDPTIETIFLRQALKGERPRRTVKLLMGLGVNLADLESALKEALTADIRSMDEGLLMYFVGLFPPSPTLLPLACRLGLAKTVQAIIDKSIHPEIDLEDGARARHLAAYHQHEELVVFLIQQGYDVNYPTREYGTAVSAAIEGVMASMKHPAMSNCSWKWRYGKLEASSTLTPKSVGRFSRLPTPEPHSDSDSDIPAPRRGRRLSRVGCETKSANDSLVCYRIVKALVIAGAEINPLIARPLGTPLHIACYLGFLPVVEFLLDHGTDINGSGGHFRSALIAAIYDNQQDVMHFLLARAINKPNNFQPPLQAIPGHAITPDVFENLAQVSHYANELITLLLKHDPEALPTESVVTPLLRTKAQFKVLKYQIGTQLSGLQGLRSTRSKMRITPSSYCPENPSMCYQKPLWSVSAAAGDNFVRADLKHDRNIRILLRVLDACLESWSAESLKRLLVHDPSLVIPSYFPVRAVERVVKDPGYTERVSEVVKLLIKCDKRVIFTSDAHALIDKQLPQSWWRRSPLRDFKKLLLRLQKPT